jgi:hypothetical protein
VRSRPSNTIRLPSRISRAADQAHHRERGDRLAASGLADDAERLARFDLEVDPVDGPDDATLGEEPGPQVLDAKQL